MARLLPKPAVSHPSYRQHPDVRTTVPSYFAPTTFLFMSCYVQLMYVEGPSRRKIACGPQPAKGVSLIETERQGRIEEAR
jgi:hypothetical protein